MSVNRLPTPSAQELVALMKDGLRLEAMIRFSSVLPEDDSTRRFLAQIGESLDALESPEPLPYTSHQCREDVLARVEELRTAGELDKLSAVRALQEWEHAFRVATTPPRLAAQRGQRRSAAQREADRAALVQAQLAALAPPPTLTQDEEDALADLQARASATSHLEWLREKFKDQDEHGTDQTLRVAVLGIFSAGKSSLINALLGETDESFLPVGNLPVTAALIELRHGPNIAITLQSTSHESRTISLEEFRSLSDQSALARQAISQHKGIERLDPALAFASTTERLIITHPAPLLREMTLFDTPGFNSGFDLHELVTEQVIGAADVVLWVFNATKTGSATDINELQHIERGVGKAIGVLNRIDEIRPKRERSLERWQAELEDVVSDAKHHLGQWIKHFVCVSAKWLREGHEASGRADLMQAVESLGNESASLRAAARLKRRVHLLELAAAVDSLVSEEQARLAAWEDEFETQLAQAVTRYENTLDADLELERKFADLPSPLRPWVDNESLQALLRGLLHLSDREWALAASPLLREVDRLTLGLHTLGAEFVQRVIVIELVSAPLPRAPRQLWKGSQSNSQDASRLLAKELWLAIDRWVLMDGGDQDTGARALLPRPDSTIGAYLQKAFRRKEICWPEGPLGGAFALFAAQGHVLPGSAGEHFEVAADLYGRWVLSSIPEHFRRGVFDTEAELWHERALVRRKRLRILGNGLVALIVLCLLLAILAFAVQDGNGPAIALVGISIALTIAWVWGTEARDWGVGGVLERSIAQFTDDYHRRLSSELARMEQSPGELHHLNNAARLAYCTERRGTLQALEEILKTVEQVGMLQTGAGQVQLLGETLFGAADFNSLAVTRIAMRERCAELGVPDSRVDTCTLFLNGFGADVFASPVTVALVDTLLPEFASEMTVLWEGDPSADEVDPATFGWQGVELGDDDLFDDLDDDLFEDELETETPTAPNELTSESLQQSMRAMWGGDVRRDG